MTPDQQQRAIEKACGWIRESGVMRYDGGEFPWTIWRKDGKTHNSFPDYLNDLNACHEMEKVLNYEQMIDYSRHVGKAVTSHLPASRAAWMDFKLINATAAQRAEAFLRTLGLWQESPTQPQ